MTYEETAELCEKHGWNLECYSPLEIRTDDGSFASGEAAMMIIGMLEEEELENQKTEQEIASAGDVRKYVAIKLRDLAEIILESIEKLNK